MAKLLQKFEHFDLWKIEHPDLAEFTKFVLRVNYEHHLKTTAPIEEVETNIEKDQYNSQDKCFYVLKTKDGKIFGTIMAWLWDGNGTLDLEKDYDLDVKHLIKTRGLNPPQIWYTGRIAVDRTIVNQSEELKAQQGLYFKLLLTVCFAHICTHPENAMVSEFDYRMHKTYVKLGIVSEELAETRFTLGSEAVPILNTGAGLQPFVDKYKHLLNYV